MGEIRVLRSSYSSGSIMPIIDWLHYGDQGLAPIRRSRFGSIVAIRDTRYLAGFFVFGFSTFDGLSGL